MNILGVMRERDQAESRVALVPETVASLLKDKQAQILVETSAGVKSGFVDKDYQDAGAKIAHRDEIIHHAPYLLGINGLSICDDNVLNKTIIGLFDPYFHKEKIAKACASSNSLIALELIPRISRAQSMDVLSSQANIAGYMAVLLLASRLPKVMPLMMTAAGTIKPAKILIIGAGVAGLQAIATAKRLGAVVFAYDVRPAVKEQVESLGAKFVDIKIDESGEGKGGYATSLSENAENLLREKLAHFAKDMDAIITTAQIPGKKAPLLLDTRVFSLMKSGSVIIDLAAPTGGNVSGSVVREWIQKENVWLYGADSLARMVPKDASFTFSKNIKSLLDLMLVNDSINWDDEIVSESLICRDGHYVNKAMAAFMKN